MRSPFVKPALGELLDPSHPINRYLVGAWILNEGMGSQVGDSTWAKNVGVATAGPTWTGVLLTKSRFFGPALTFNGSSQYVQIPHQTYYDATNAFSIELVFDPAINTTSLVFGRGGFGTSTDWGIGQSGTHAIFQLSGTSCSTVGTLPGLNTFVHVVGTYDGSNIRIYLNGILSNTVAKTGFSYSGAADFFLGRNPSAATFFNGRVGRVRFWAGRALNLEDVHQLYLEPYAGWLPSTRDRLSFQFQAVPRTSQTVQAKASIRATTTRTAQAQARIRTTSLQTAQAKASITNKQQVQITAKAAIDTPETVNDSQMRSWTISDTFGAISREFNLETRGTVNAQAGNEVLIYGGYDQRRILLLDGIIDEAQKSSQTDDQFTVCTGRDAGAREIQSLTLTKVWNVVPPTSVTGVIPPAGVSTWTAHDIIRDAASVMGLSVGALEFPNYYLYSSFVAVGQTLLSIIQELVQPFNQFARIQYVTQVHSRLLSVIKVDWTAPRSGGYVVSRSQHSNQVRRQTVYLDQPRLNEIQKIIIRGAAWVTPKLDLGLTVRVEYNRNTVMAEVANGLLGQVPAAGDAIVKNANSGAYLTEVTTETTVTETLYGDKVINRDEKIVINGNLSSRTQERYWYFEPGTSLLNHQSPQPDHVDVDTFITQSTAPSANALLYLVHTRRSGYIDVSYRTDDGLGNVTTVSGTLFREVFRNLTQYNYDSTGSVSCENNSTQEYDASAGTWGLTTHTSRTHSQTTAGSVRTTLLNFVFEDSKFKIAAADTQQVGGARPILNQTGGRQAVITHQAQSPQGEVDAAGNVIDPGNGFFIWSFENPYMGQDTTDLVYQLALDEQAFQLLGYKWDEVEFESIFNPNLFIGQSVPVEVESGVFKDYIVEQVTHRFSSGEARTTGNAKRLTLEEIP